MHVCGRARARTHKRARTHARTHTHALTRAGLIFEIDDDELKAMTAQAVARVLAQAMP